MDVMGNVYIADPYIFLIFGIIVVLFFLLINLWNHFRDRICLFTREPHFSYAEKIRKIINGRWAKRGLKVEGEYRGRPAMASVVTNNNTGGSISLGIKSYKDFPAKMFYVQQPRLARDAMIEDNWVIKRCLDYIGDTLFLGGTREHQALTEGYIENEFDYLVSICEKFERGELEP